MSIKNKIGYAMYIFFVGICLGALGVNLYRSGMLTKFLIAVTVTLAIICYLVLAAWLISED